LFERVQQPREPPKNLKNAVFRHNTNDTFSKFLVARFLETALRAVSMNSLIKQFELIHWLIHKFVAKESGKLFTSLLRVCMCVCVNVLGLHVQHIMIAINPPKTLRTGLVIQMTVTQKV